MPLASPRIFLRAHCDFLTEKTTFSYSTTGKKFKPFGNEFTMIFQGKTFQGVRYSLFHYNDNGAEGGFAAFDQFTIEELHPRGLMKPIPFGKEIVLKNNADGLPVSIAKASHFKVVDQNLGRVALQTQGKFLSVNAANGEITLKECKPAPAETFQWIETPYGDLVLMSLATNRFLTITKEGAISATSPGPKPGRKHATCWTWHPL